MSVRHRSKADTNGTAANGTSGAKAKKDLWGRASKDSVTTGTVLMVLIIFLTTPFLVLYFHIALRNYGGSVIKPVLEMIQGDQTLWNLYAQFTPRLAWESTMIYVAWYFLQVFLYLVVPGPIAFGQLTPGGYELPYKVNGLNCWIVTHVLFLGAVNLRWISGTIIYDHWGPMLVLMNILGYALAAFSYLKACLFPTHKADVKFSGSIIYDFFMGAEMNPRFGSFDFKLFHNGRPGIVLWTLINLSYCFKQYELYGEVTNSCILVNIFQAIYVLDFFYYEDWYLKTIDISHDHFGWYLAWGDLTWLPMMYTLQGHWLVLNPYVLPNWAAGLVLVWGLMGYYIFRSANNQRWLFRKQNGKLNIGGKPAEFIEAEYGTADGKRHKSLLLTSGWWRMSRHFNYVGDLMLSSAYGFACGFGGLLPHFYTIYMVILLVHRTFRDEHRCSNKYGKYWKQYCDTVPWRILPYVF